MFGVSSCHFVRLSVKNVWLCGLEKDPVVWQRNRFNHTMKGGNKPNNFLISHSLESEPEVTSGAILKMGKQEESHFLGYHGHAAYSDHAVC